MATPIDEARAAGYSEQEIQAHLAAKVKEAQDAGYSTDEIGTYLGIKPIDHSAANTALAARVQGEIQKGQDGSKRQTALQAMGQTVKDASTIYAPIEGAFNLATGALLGFPSYLVGGLGGLAARHTFSPDTDPKEIAQKFADVMTYHPQTEAGQRFTSTLTSPLHTLTAWSEAAGKKVADKTDSPTLAAITEATIQMLPAFLIPAFGRAINGKTPTNSDFYTNAKDLTPDTSNVRSRVEPALTNEIADKLQTVYEKTGIDPETVKAQALEDPKVMADLVSSNRTPLAGTEPPVVPPKPPADTPAPTPPPEGTPAAAQAAVLDRISVGEGQKKGWSFGKFYTAVKDDLYPIAEVEKKLNGGASLEVAESPYHLARLVRGAAGKATQFLDYGTFDWSNYKTTGPGLKTILEPFSKDLDGFRAYAVARRAEELHARGLETGVPPAEAALVVKSGAKYAQAFEQLQTYQNSLTKYLKDSGVIGEEAYAAMKDANKDYVPFYRMMDKEGGGGAGAGMKVHNPLRAIKGSERIILDPLESVIKNTYLYTALAERNAVGAAFGRLVTENPAGAADIGISVVKTSMKPIDVTAAELARHGLESNDITIFRPNAMRPSADQIRYFEDGKAITLKVPDELAEAFNAADRQSTGLLLRMIAAPAKTLRAGAILAPDFMLRNVMRDQLTAFTFSKNGYVPVWDMLSGAMSIAKKDGDFQNWLKSGGANAALVSMDREYLQSHLFKLDKDAGLMSRGWNVVKSPLEILRISSELMENATRLGEFKKAGATDKATMQDAAFQAREVTLDFSRIGAQTRALNMISAFFNAGVEGTDRTVRAFKDRPIATTAKTAAGITLPSVLLWYANNSTDERQARWREVPNWERDMFWIVMTDEHTYRIPKPFELGIIFGSSAERMLDKFSADKPDAMKGFMTAVGQMAGPNTMPTGAVPLLEQVTNHSFFTGNPLIPARMEGILPEYQYNEYTSQVARAVGKVVGAFPGLHDASLASPIVIDNYIRGWTGTVGVYVEQALDYGLRKAGVLPDPVTPIAALADIPVVKAFVVRYPTASAQSVQDFYDRYTSQKKTYDTFNYLIKNGDPTSATAELKLDPSAFARLDGIHQTLGLLNGYIRLVYRNPDMSASDKRQLIDTMYGQMIEMSRAGNAEMVRIDAALEGKDVAPVPSATAAAPAAPRSAPRSISKSTQEFSSKLLTPDDRFPIRTAPSPQAVAPEPAVLSAPTPAPTPKRRVR